MSILTFVFRQIRPFVVTKKFDYEKRRGSVITRSQYETRQRFVDKEMTEHTPNERNHHFINCASERQHPILRDTGNCMGYSETHFRIGLLILRRRGYSYQKCSMDIACITSEVFQYCLAITDSWFRALKLLVSISVWIAKQQSWKFHKNVIRLHRIGSIGTG